MAKPRLYVIERHSAYQADVVWLTVGAVTGEHARWTSNKNKVRRLRFKTACQQVRVCENAAHDFGNYHLDYIARPIAAVWGRKSRRVRMEKTTPEQRSALARKAAGARWAKKRKKRSASN